MFAATVLMVKGLSFGLECEKNENKKKPGLARFKKEFRDSSSCLLQLFSWWKVCHLGWNVKKTKIKRSQDWPVLKKSVVHVCCNCSHGQRFVSFIKECFDFQSKVDSKGLQTWEILHKDGLFSVLKFNKNLLRSIVWAKENVLTSPRNKLA